MARFGRSTLATRFIPPGATKVADKLTDAVVYVFDNARSKPSAIGYAGKAVKPTFHYNFPTLASREKYVREFFAGQRARLASKVEMNAKRTSSNLLIVGDVLMSSWGYDQTNVDFYEVTASVGAYVTICKVGVVSTANGSMSGTCLPIPGKFIDKPMRKLVQYGDSVKIASYANARKWNTQPVNGAPVGPAVSFSSYH